RRARVDGRGRRALQADQSAAAGRDPGRGRRLHVPRHADPAARLIAETVQLVNFRSYERLELGLRPGLILAVGPNGAGKTNLLEALHVGTQGFSPRTRADAQLVRSGAEAAIVALRGSTGTAPLEISVLIRTAGGKEAKVNGMRVASVERLRATTTTL